MANFMSLQIKPHPAGKDRTRYGTTQQQLGAEWIDLKNMTNGPVNLAGVDLYHIAYSPQHPNGVWDKVKSFAGILPAGQILRLHSGSGPVTHLRVEDLQGAHLHWFTDRNNYVWNNAEGDCAALTMNTKFEPFDKACYDPNPPEGVILVRVQDKFHAPAASYAYRR